jgi:signal transduction histidine kinase
LLVCVFAVVGIVVYQQVKNSRYDKVNVRLEALSQKLRDEIDEQYEEHTILKTEKLNRIIATLLPSSLVQLYDSAGIMVYKDSLLSMRSLSLPNELNQQMRYMQDIHIHHIRYRLLWARIEILENHNWVMLLAAPTENIDEDLEQLSFILWMILGLAVLFSALIVNVVVRRSFHPLSRMIDITNRVSESSLHERINLSPSFDEVSMLGSSVNRMIERLEASFKNQKQFIADASHELRTPLAIIQSELEYANRSQQLSDAKKSVRLAINELDHLLKLSTDLLLLAKLENTDTKEAKNVIRLDELLTDVVQRMTRLARKKKIALQLTLSTPIEIQGNEDRLRGALLNVVDNAIRYTPREGTIKIHLRQQDRRAYLTIQDTGIGIPSEDIPHIFKPFYRGSAQRSKVPGNGLGLSLVKKIIDLHQGSVEIQSDGKSGSTFIIRIPIQ